MLNVEKIEKDNKLHFVWTKHIFFLANIIFVFTIAISWLVVSKTADLININHLSKYIPFIIMTPISLILWFISFYFNQNDIKLFKINTSSKYLNIYFLSHLFFILNILLSSLLYILLDIVLPHNNIKIQTSTIYIIQLSFTAFLSLISIVLNKLSIFKMELDIYKKKYDK
ncbi:MAG: hypothetical protein LBF02_01250 [Mycoplasmataceae bacterium]|jgi:hypothetical protein|nr:hypothetical protein [Mycoplasmataceae bacterium]